MSDPRDSLMRVERVSAHRRLARMRIALAALLLIHVAGCSTAEPSPSTPENASGSVTRTGITLSATAEPARAASGEVIEVVATLEHDAPADLELSGSSTGFVFFSVTRFEDGVTSGDPVMSSDCVRHVLPADERTIVALEKAGGFDPDNPEDDFKEAYFSDPELRLPPGTWRIDVTTAATIGLDCGGEPLDLALELIVTVTD